MTKQVLIIGGTRNMGYFLVNRLLQAGFDVTTLNRGISTDTLPEQVHRLHADRSDPRQMKRALLAREFDIVVDFVMLNGDDASMIVDMLAGKVGRYIYISSGQVYLVRENLERPFKESDYEGRLMPAPKMNTFAWEEWNYGIGKRAAEDIFARAYAEKDFPYTSLRLPMVMSERDGFNRLNNYLLRLEDGGPILLPETPNFPLKHIDAMDVVEVIMKLISSGKGIGQAYNISQDDAVPLEEFLHILSDLLNVPLNIAYFKRSELEANGFLPDCSPFSERWMSELDNSLSKSELGMTYTPVTTYLARIVDFYRHNRPSKPISYRRRSSEIQMVALREQSGEN